MVHAPIEGPFGSNGMMSRSGYGMLAARSRHATDIVEACHVKPRYLVIAVAGVVLVYSGILVLITR
jgi:hypothetical protein